MDLTINPDNLDEYDDPEEFLAAIGEEIPKLDAAYGADWAWLINEATLDMADGPHCIHGQLTGDDMRWLDWEDRTSSNYSLYASYTATWLEIINQLRAARPKGDA